jgi:hypothetical protein
LPEELKGIWEPLLDQLDDTFEGFLETLLWCIFDLITPPADASPLHVAPASVDKGYLATLAAWLALLVVKEDNEVQRDFIRSSLLRPHALYVHLAELLFAQS